MVPLSGSCPQAEACRLAAKRDMIASFSRALTEGLQYLVSDQEVDTALAGSIAEIYRASTEKV